MIGLLLPSPDDSSGAEGIRQLLEHAARAGLRDVIVIAGPDDLAGAADVAAAPSMLGLHGVAIVARPRSGGVVESLLAARPFAAADCCCIIVGPIGEGVIDRTIAAFYRAAGPLPCAVAADSDAPGMVVVGDGGMLDLCGALQPRLPRRVDGADLIAALAARGPLVRIAVEPAAPMPARPLRLAA